MTSNTLKIVTGKLPEPDIGQWIEATYTLADEDSFAFGATICRRTSPDEFCQYYFGTPVPLEFEAGLALALYQLSCAPPFDPSRAGSVIIAPSTGDFDAEQVETLEVMLRSPVRSSAMVPLAVRDRLSEGRELVMWHMKLAASGALL